MSKNNTTIYQSMWFKPYQFDIDDKNPILNNGRSIGGWVHRRHFYMAWALSVYRLKKYYKNLVLVTDHIGKELLIDKLELPYNEIDIDLENLNVNHSLWALGKLKTYGKAKNDFLHLDGDVFIWKKLPDFSCKNELIVQNLEYNQHYYKTSLIEIENSFDYIPNEIYKIVKNKKNIISFNAGTFGSNDIGFIKEYVEKALEFVDRNTNCFSKTDLGRFNTVYEQLFCYYLAIDKKIKITPVFKEMKPNKTDVTASKLFNGQLVNFLDVNKMNYIHPLGMNKKSILIACQLEKRLQYEFPKVYNKIIELDKSNSLL